MRAIGIQSLHNFNRFPVRSCVPCFFFSFEQLTSVFFKPTREFTSVLFKQTGMPKFACENLFAKDRNPIEMLKKPSRSWLSPENNLPKRLWLTLEREALSILGDLWSSLP